MEKVIIKDDQGRTFEFDTFEKLIEYANSCSSMSWLPDGYTWEIIDESKDRISVEWCTEDVLTQCDWLTKEQAREVLQMCEHRHDCTIGINWEFIEDIACDMFPIHSTKQV